MFPSGWVGVALVVFRFVVVGSLLSDGTRHWTLITSLWSGAFFLVPAGFLLLGFMTPYASVASVLLQLGVLVLFRGNENMPHLALSALNSAVLAVLGPGAYSMDARLFGRKLVTLPPGRRV